MDIPEYVSILMKRLDEAGFESYLVGGCVRDALMGKVPHDYDLTTSALPGEMLSVFSDHKVIETGLKHGTLTVVSQGIPVEITTYRIDGGYLDNRHPDSVSFTRNLHDDLSRRDFTVNAMAMSLFGAVTDDFGGKDDLSLRRIRCVGDPELRFNEDGLRILRALRFASVLDFEIDPLTAAAIHSKRGLLGGISAERIREELFKLMCGTAAERVMTDFTDVILQILGGIKAAEYRHAVEMLSVSPADPVVRLAVLYSFASDENSLGAALRRLKCSRVQARSAADCMQIITERHSRSATELAVLASQMGYDTLFADLSVASRCGNGSADNAKELLCEMKNRGACFSLSELAADGIELIGLGVKEGKEVGKLLERLFSAVAEGECENTHDALISLANRINAGGD